MALALGLLGESMALSFSTVPSPSLHSLRTSKPFSSSSSFSPTPPASRKRFSCRAHKVEIEHLGVKHVLEVAEDETVLEKVLEAGIDVPYDCKLGVCMTCPARLLKGTVEQPGAMLSDDVVERGYALLCASLPRSDCEIRTIPEEELLSLQLVTSGH